MSAHKRNVQTFDNLTCPFCSLLCDDISVENHSEQLKVLKNACHIAKSRFENPADDLHPIVDGKPATVNQAIKQAAQILRKSKQPLITGLGTDVRGMRAVMKLADKTGSMIDHMHSEGAIRNTKVLQNMGWVMTTMGEIKNRADLLIMVGTDGSTNYPRFFERVVLNKNSLFLPRDQVKDIVFLGDKSKYKIDPEIKKARPKFIQCPNDQLGEVIGVLHAMIAGNGIDNNKLTKVKLAPLLLLAERIKKAKYGVIVWEPAALDYEHAELTIQSIGEMVKYLNRNTRFAGFSLSGNDGGVTASNVCAWQCGYPLRVNFGNGIPEYDPHKFSARYVLQRKETDALIWISSFGNIEKIHRARIPAIILSSSPVPFKRKPHVFIPVSTPGLDDKGQLFRTDSVVSLPVRKIRSTDKPGVGEILDSITELL